MDAYLSASDSFSAFISRSLCLIESCFLRCSIFFSHGVVFFFPAIVLWRGETKKKVQAVTILSVKDNISINDTSNRSLTPWWC